MECGLEQSDHGYGGKTPNVGQKLQSLDCAEPAPHLIRHDHQVAVAQALHIGVRLAVLQGRRAAHRCYQPWRQGLELNPSCPSNAARRGPCMLNPGQPASSAVFNTA